MGICNLANFMTKPYRKIKDRLSIVAGAGFINNLLFIDSYGLAPQYP